MTVVELVEEGYAASGAFNGGRLAEACRLMSRMIDEGATIAMTLSGAMTPAGIGGIAISLMEAGFIDLVIATGANLYHDLHFALDLPVHQGDFRVDDAALLEAGVVRIYDIFLTEQLLLDTDRYVQEAMERARGAGLVPPPDRGGCSTARVHNALGRDVLGHTAHPERSMVASL
ncbi:MAG: deoxyhypusine synthase family protein [Candidatus Riflebacteria bacterium]|nr:deoxyhypusine synthase family protein [Candidatus Riflebacteria bacterium]